MRVASSRARNFSKPCDPLCVHALTNPFKSADPVKTSGEARRESGDELLQPSDRHRHLQPGRDAGPRGRPGRRVAAPPAACGKISAGRGKALAGARRSVGTATANEERLRREIAELGGQSDQLTDEAREALRNQDESAARVALLRKQ